MLVRPIGTGLLAGVVATASALVLTAGPATADPSPTFVPTAADVVGVGSDTTQISMNALADGFQGVPGYNDRAGATVRLASFDATGSAQVTLREGATPVNRPNGSTAGKNLLRGSGNNPDVDFARSSSRLSDPEVQDGLFAFPFALDVLQMAVKPGGNAPSTLTKAQIVGIYKGDITNWSEVGGTAGTIVPLIPQSGSGTRSFFEGELRAANGGTPVTLGAAVKNTQEHDPTDIVADPNAIAPYSVGRAALSGDLQLVGGEFSARRAVYNVVRQADVEKPEIQEIFGTSGFLCSADARSLIEAGGLTQLASVTAGGVCGQVTQAATSNFATNEAAATTTTLTATSPVGGRVDLASTVSSTGASPTGTVAFLKDDDEEPFATARLAQGQARTSAALPAGTYTIRARFVPEVGSGGSVATSTPVEVTVGEVSTTTLAVQPAQGAFGTARTLTATVSSGGSPANGQVTFAVGTLRRTGTLSGGVATVTLPRDLAARSYDVVATYAGSGAVGGSVAEGTLVVAAAAARIAETLPATVAAGKRATGTITVTGGGLPATGKVVVLRGTKKLAAGTLRQGKLTLTLPALPKGRNVLTVKYAGSGNVSAATSKFTLTQK